MDYTKGPDHAIVRARMVLYNSHRSHSKRMAHPYKNVEIAMEIPFSHWYTAIDVRRSRRKYDPARPVPGALLGELRDLCAQFRPFSCARAELMTERCEEAFRGAVGSYGKVTGARAFVAFIGDSAGRHFQEATGYTGEGIVLAATALGLATCWVAGFFRPEVVAELVELHDNERVLAITPIGYAVEQESLEEKFMTAFGRTHRRKPLSALVNGDGPEGWPGWIKTALEAARLAPSAINRQPWGFRVQDNAVTVSIRTGEPDFNVSKRLDCGIAMLHIEVGALYAGHPGTWEFLESPQVGRFAVVNKTA